MDVQIAWDILLILFITATVAGFIDTLAGGGGLITLPVMLILQIPVLNVLAINKVQGSFGTLIASANMLKHRVVKLEQLKRPFMMSLLGAAIGTILVHLINANVLEIFIPIVLILIGFYFLLTPKAGQQLSQSKVQQKTYELLVVPVIGFYDGILGPGTGSFFSLAGVALRGQKIIQATANAKVFNLASNLASAFIFIVSGKVIWLLAFAMMLGQMVGATLASKIIISHGAKIIRPMIVLVCFVMLARYFYEQFN